MKTKKIMYLSLITSIGIVLQIIESYIPSPFVGIPGAKMGLANIVNLVVLVVFGIKNALVIAILRCSVAMLGTGSVTGFFYSLAGAICSILIMWCVYSFLSKYFSLIGVSIYGALSHNIAQLFVASCIIHNWLIFTYLPMMMLMSIFTGYFVGLAARYVSKHLKKIVSNEPCVNGGDKMRDV